MWRFNLFGGIALLAMIVFAQLAPHLTRPLAGAALLLLIVALAIGVRSKAAKR